MSPHEAGARLDIGTFRDDWDNGKVFPALTDETGPRDGMRDLGKTNKYGSALKHWIGSGNTNGTYGLPALCGGAKIYRKGSTRSSKTVQDQAKQKQCDKLRSKEQQTVEDREQLVLRKCGATRAEDIAGENGNALYKKSDFGGRKPTYQKFRRLALQEALDLVAMPDAANRGSVSKLEELIIRKLLLPNDNLGVPDGWRNQLRGSIVGETDDARRENSSPFVCGRITPDQYRRIHGDFEDWLIRQLKDAKGVANRMERAQVFGSDLLEHVMNNADLRGVYRKNFILTGM